MTPDEKRDLEALRDAVVYLAEEIAWSGHDSSTTEWPQVDVDGVQYGGSAWNWSRQAHTMNAETCRRVLAALHHVCVSLRTCAIMGRGAPIVCSGPRAAFS